MEALAAEYRQLRTVPGHFSGDAWNDAVDSFQGRKHEVMAQLGDLLGDGRHTRDEVVGLLGEPDQVVDPSSTLWPVMNKVGTASEALVYSWRGNHDFLYFPVRDGRVLRSAWWMAYE